MKPKHRTNLMKNLYQEFGEDLARVQTYQRGFYQTLTFPMFDDVEAEWLYLLVRHLDSFGPVNALEIGPCSGWSTSWILRALADAKRGFLLSVDPQDAAAEKLPEDLKEYWDFYHGPVEEFYESLPLELDFLLIDSNHNSPAVESILENLLPRVRPGGFVCIHDIYMLATPAQGEALAIFKYLKSIKANPFTPSKVFAQSFNAIERVREEVGLGRHIHSHDTNPALFYEVPDDSSDVRESPEAADRDGEESA